MTTYGQPTEVLRGWVVPATGRPAPAGAGKASAGGGAAFALFVLVTGVLFLRPGDLIAGLEGAPIYEVCILACAATALPAMVRSYSRDGLARRPIDACVAGLLVAVVLSCVARGDIGAAVSEGVAFTKIGVYYVLVVTTLDTPRRLRGGLGWMQVFITVHAGLAVLNFHEAIDLPGMAPVFDWFRDPATGEMGKTFRLCGGGIFANPNDLSRVMVVGIILALDRLTERRGWLLRPVWAGSMALCGYALVLTQSRGGFIDLIVAVLTLLTATFGVRKTAVWSAVVLPVLFLAFAGRQTDLSVSEGTGQQRIRLWSDGFDGIRESPVFGIGAGRYPEITGGLVAHNSFFHAFVELGVVGGTLFLGAFYFAVTLPGRAARSNPNPPDPVLRRTHPVLLAIVVGYAAGLLSSSRVYTVPTYLLLGLTAVQTRLAAPADCGGAPPARFDVPTACRLFALGLAYLAVTYVYIRLTVTW